MNISQIWPEWQVIQLIGEGGFGKVYEISRNRFGIDEHRAMKVISIPVNQSEYDKTISDGMDEHSASSYYRSMVDEFVKEISLLSQLRGTPNIVVYDDYKVIERTDSFGWDIYIMMELLTPLSKILRKGPLPKQEILKIGNDICDALTACHKKNILHRDIKIDNIFVSSDGIYKLGDFGIARKAEHSIGLYTKTGTESYMAPEVYKGEPYGKRADIYSLGMVLYRLLNNNRDPFLPPYPQPITVTDKNNSTVRRMKGEELPLPSNADPELGQVILRACSYSQSQRYPTGEIFKRALNNPSGSSTPASTEEKTQGAFSNTRSSTQYDNTGNSYRTSEVSKTQSAFTNVSRSKQYESAPYTHPEPKKKTGLIIAIVAVLVIGIGVAIAIIANSNKDDTSTNDNDTSQSSQNSGNSSSVEEATKKYIEIPVDLRKGDVNDYHYKPSILINGNTPSEDKIEKMNLPESIYGYGDFYIPVYFNNNDRIELQLNGITYYECKLDYESGSIDSFTYYPERFSN